MQYINHWPDTADLHFPKAVDRDIHRQLLEPFDSVGEAKDFWEETSCTLIILTPSDTIEDLKRSDTWSQIEFALTYPEYTVPLPMEYVLSVTIVNDSGSGIFLVIPPELSHITSIGVDKP